MYGEFFSLTKSAIAIAILLVATRSHYEYDGFKG